MQFAGGEAMLGKQVDYVFLGACTNGRIEDFRAFASIVKGRQKAANITAWLVPGSWRVLDQIKAEGLDKVLADAGFAIRQPGCSACLAMNDDKIPAGKLAVSTSNRNFGYYDICLTAVFLLMPFVTLQLRDGAFRFLLDSPNEENR